MKRVLKNVTEAELVVLANDKNTSVSNQAFEEIYKRFNKHLRFYIHKKMAGSSVNNDDREDILQTVFEKAFSKMSNFETKFKLSTWLMKITKNHIIDLYRKKGLDIQRDITEDEEGNETTMEFADFSHIPENQYIVTQKNEFVHNLINARLKGEYKEVITLLFLQEKSYQEVADQMGIPLGTVKAKVYRAKEMLREGLDKKVLLTA